MAPKKTKAAVSSSEPEPQKTARSTGRKRRHSDASNVSDRPESSQTMNPAATAATPKRRKKAKAAQEPQVIIEEEEQEVVRQTSEAAQPRIDVVDEEEILVRVPSNESIELDEPREKHVHFGLNDENDDHSTAQHNTPYPKMTIKRRFTLSPAANGESKRYKTTTHRTSLPSTLSQETQSPTTIVQEHQFAPLRAVLDDRIRRRLKRNRLSEEQNEIEDHDRHDSRTQKELEQLRVETVEKENRLKDLMLELETQRQFGIDINDDDHVEHEKQRALEAELFALRREVAEGRAHTFMNGAFDDDMMVLDNSQEYSQEVASYPELPVPETPTTPVKRASQESTSEELVTAESLYPTITPSKRSWDAERRRFEDSILALSQEANDAKANLRILTIELQALASADENTQGVEILRSIRESFNSVRDGLEHTLPDTVPEDISDLELIELLISNVKEFANRLRVQDHELKQQVALSDDLRAQIDGLLDRLAEAKIRQGSLEQQWRELDESGESKERDIADLEAQLSAAEDEREVLERELLDKTEQLKTSEMESTDLQINLEKLNTSLQGYRDEETRLQALITKMEQEHSTLVASMNKEREETVQDLEDRLDGETQLRTEAEKQSDDRQTRITGLELLYETAETDRDALRKELEALKDELDAEQGAREQAEADVQEKEAQVDDLETRVGHLEEELEELKSQIDQLSGLNESERRQREAAESALDDANVQIEELDEKLRQQGSEANNLRLKMFEVQQANAAKVKELEEVAADRDEQYEADIAREVERRDAAEEASRTREATILDLQTSLEELEQNMRDVLAERDARIAALEEELDEQKAEVARLRDVLRETEDLRDAENVGNQQRIEELEDSIVSLKDTIADHESTINGLNRDAAKTEVLHNSEMDDRNTVIAELHHTVAELNVRVNELEDEKAGLERRVTHEAESMLQLAAEKEDQIDALKDTIRDKQAKILVVEQKAVAADKQWQEVLAARDQEVETLRVTNDTRAGTIAGLVKQRDELKTRFEEYVRRSTSAMTELQDTLARTKNIVDETGEGLKEEAERVLEDLQDLEDAPVAAHTHARVHDHTTKKTASKKKKRVYDSGFHVGSDEVDVEAVPA